MERCVGRNGWFDCRSWRLRTYCYPLETTSATRRVPYPDKLQPFSLQRYADGRGGCCNPPRFKLSRARVQARPANSPRTAGPQPTRSCRPTPRRAASSRCGRPPLLRRAQGCRGGESGCASCCASAADRDCGSNDGVCSGMGRGLGGQVRMRGMLAARCSRAAVLWTCISGAVLCDRSRR